MESTQEITITEPAAPSESVIEQAVVETVEKDVGPSGMETQESTAQDDIELEETSIGQDQAVQTTHSALTDYVDVSATRTVKSKVTAVDVLDKNFVFPPDYFKVVERSYPLGVFDLPSTSPDQYPLRLDIANALLGRQSVASKLLYARYIRYNLEVQLKVLATNFHFGQLMVVWRPSYSPYMPFDARVNGKDLIMNILCSNDALDGFVPACTPYDNVYTASQLAHHILPVTAGATLTIKCPWTLNRQYVPTTLMMSPNYHIGFLDVYYLTPIGPSDIDAARLQVYARFTDIVGFGYKAPQNLCSDTGDFIRRRKYQNKGSDYSNNRLLVKYPPTFRWQARHPTEISSGWDTWNLRDWSPTASQFVAKPWWATLTTRVAKNQVHSWTEIMDEAVKRSHEEPSPTVEESQAGEIEAQTKGGALYSMYNNTVRTANTVAAWVGDALAFFGLSKPPMKGVPARFAHLAPPVSNAVGPDFCVSNGVNPDSLVVNQRSDHSEMTLIQNLGACEVYYGWATLSVNSKAIEGWLYPGFPIWPLAPADDFGYGYRTPTSMLLEKFCLWRGNCKYRFHFSCSSFVSARIAVTVRYENNPSEEAIGMVPTQIFEVKGDTTVEGEIPYLNAKPWLDADEAFCYVKMELLDTPVSWKRAVAQPIYVSVWFSYPGFQVAMPFDRINIGIPWMCTRVANIKPKPQSTRLVEKNERGIPYEQPQSGPLPGTSKMSCSKQYGMNDIFTSVYQLAKRFNPVFGRVIAPLKPYAIWQYDTTILKDQVQLVTIQPSNSHFAVCFRWVRGSYDLLANGSHQMVDMLDSKYCYQTNDVLERPVCLANQGPATYDRNLYMFSVTNNHMNRLGQNLIASRSPYHSDYPFVSAPVVHITPDLNAGNMQWQPITEYCFEKTNITVADGLAQTEPRMPYMELAYADDLCYNQWMGCPFGVVVNKLEQAYFPTVKSFRDLSGDGALFTPPITTKEEQLPAEKESGEIPTQTPS